MALTTLQLPKSHLHSLMNIEDGYWWFQGRVYWASELIRQYQKLQKIKDPVHYMDLGCGTGGFAKQIIEEFKIKKMALLDGDPYVLELTDCKSKIETHQIDFSKDFDLPWKPNLITCMDVLEHIQDDERFLKNLAERIVWGAGVVVSVPALPSLFSEWDRQLKHYRRYTVKTLSDVVGKAGLSIISMKFMWSALVPFAFFRKFKTKAYTKNMEFEPVSSTVNHALIQMSKFEWAFSEIMPLPFGTSLIMLAVKK